MNAQYYLEAARVPISLDPCQFDDWRISRLPLPEARRDGCHWENYTLLRHLIHPALDMSNLHLADEDGVVQKWDVVMEDSPKELRRHLPIWLSAYGKVLVTGLGLGCVVRGLLANPHVSMIDVIEIDPAIICVVGREFQNNPRVSIAQGDALGFRFSSDSQWDFAWHDIWTPENVGLQQEHARLIMRCDEFAKRQGAWAFPREMKILSHRNGFPLLGGKRAA